MPKPLINSDDQQVKAKPQNSMGMYWMYENMTKNLNDCTVSASKHERPEGKIFSLHLKNSLGIYHLTFFLTLN